MVRMGSGNYKNRIRGLVGLESLILFVFYLNTLHLIAKHVPTIGTPGLRGGGGTELSFFTALA